jgi:hypothetical protein
VSEGRFAVQIQDQLGACREQVHAAKHEIRRISEAQDYDAYLRTLASMPASAAAVPADLSATDGGGCASPAAAGAADARASASALLYPDDFETASDIHVRDEPPPRHTSYAEIIKDKRPRKARVGGATAAGSAHSSPSSSDGVDVAFLGLEPAIDDAFFDDVGPPAYYVDPMALGDSSSDEEVPSSGAVSYRGRVATRGWHRHRRAHAHAGAEA